MLSESVVGATGGDDEEDEGEGEVGEGKAAESNNGGNYEVVGTLANDWSEVPTWIKETIAVRSEPFIHLSVHPSIYLLVHHL